MKIYFLCLVFLVYIHYIIRVYIHYITIYYLFVYLIHYNIRIYTLHYYLLSICILNSLYYSFMFAYHYHLFVYLIHYIIRFYPVYHYSLFIHSYAWSIACLNSLRTHCIYTFIFYNIYIHSFTHLETQVLVSLFTYLLYAFTYSLWLTETPHSSVFLLLVYSFTYSLALSKGGTFPYFFKSIFLSIIFPCEWLKFHSLIFLFANLSIHIHRPFLIQQHNSINNITS